MTVKPKPMSTMASRPTSITRLARPLQIERSCAPDREAMLAALRVALGLPRALPRHEAQR